jgi:hypothetical protein
MPTCVIETSESVEIATRSSKLFQSLPAQLLTFEAGAIKEVLELLIENEKRGSMVNKLLLADTLNEVILRHSRLQHHSEVSWAVWAALRYGITLDGGSAKEIPSCDNAIVALLALDAQTKSLLPGLDVTAWASLMKEKELEDAHWLLAYEALEKGWLPSSSGTDYDQKAADRSVRATQPRSTTAVYSRASSADSYPASSAASPAPGSLSISFPGDESRHPQIPDLPRHMDSRIAP